MGFVLDDIKVCRTVFFAVIDGFSIIKAHQMENINIDAFSVLCLSKHVELSYD